MRALLASLAVLFLSTGASAQIESPFVPLSGAADRVVTMVDTTSGRPPSRGATRITHHAGWSRVERVVDGLVLQENIRSDMQGGSSFTAVEVRRGAATLPSIISQSDMLNPARWGLPR